MTSRYAITRATRPRRLAAGFTLIELIIVTVIVAILASVAIPSYTHYVQRNHRATVQALLADIASRQQQFFLNRRQFGSLSDLGVTVPADVASHYNVSVVTTLPAAGAPTFTLTAAPQGGQVSDHCGTMTINQLGERTPTQGCW
ncbi:MAG TPA: type IV pilin protein [Burkholderiaceae bacterium]|nr:type IV pilin protein [Burkholderiaceae bacterium]